MTSVSVISGKNTPKNKVRMDDVIEEIQNLFNLAAISESIANDWAGSNYLDFNEVDPPEALTDGTCLDCLQLVQQELQKADLKDGPAFWKRLVEAEVAPVGLVGFLWALIEVALKKDSNLEQVKCGAFASSIYMKLCTVNGASIYKFYQQSIVQKVLDIWRLALRVVLYGVRNVQITEKTQRRNKKSKKVECNDEAPDACLPQQDMLRILNKSTNDLYIFLNTIPLADQPEIAIHTARYISDLAELDHFEKEISYKVVDGLDEFANLKLYCERSLALCHILAHGRHSADCSLIYERIVQPRLLLWSWQNTAYGGAASMPTSLIHFGEVMLRFVEQRIAVADEKELKIIDELIYALIVRCPDRAEYRARVPHTIISLIKIMPQNRHYNFRFTLWDLATRNNSMATVVELSILMIKEFDWNLPDPYTEELANANKNKQQSHENNAIKEELESDEEGVDMDRTRKRKDKKRKQKERDALHNSTLADETHTGTRAVEKAKKVFELPYFPKGKALLYRILIGAIVHSSSTIRARALCLVAELLQNKDHVDFVKDAAFDLIFSYNYAEDIVFDEGARPSANPTAIDRLFPILTMCCRDEKTQVRKSAVLCLEKYLPYVAEADFSAAIEILKRLCLDESHVVRKQAADAITCLLSGIDEGSDRWHIVANSWILNVFPLIGDSDATVAELVAKLVLELVLNPLIEASMGNVQVRGLAAEILKRIYPGSSSRSEFIRALREQASHNRLNSIIVNNVQRQLENSTSEEDTSELWTLFECLVVVFPDKIDSKLVFNKWFSFTHPPRPLMMKNDWIPTPTIPYGKTASLLLSIIRLIKKKFSADERRLLCTNLEEHLNGYTVPTDLINEVWLTLATLADHQKSGDIKHESPELQLFASRTYRFALQVIKNIWKASCIEEQLTFLKYQVEEQAETFLVRMLIGTGYAAQYNLDVIYLLDQDEIDDIREEPLLISFLLKITTDSLSDLRFRLKESRKNIKLDKGRHPFGLPTKRNGKWAPESDWLKQRLVHSDVVSNFPMKKFSDGIRAAAAIAIGTHCIFDGELTKEFLPELINELQASSSAAVRANLLVPCCDMVKRFAATDIQGLPDALAIVLLDPHPHIRAQCLQMMAHLIKEQFVKWEGLIMHLYTIMCIDDSPETASFAQSSFQNALLPIMDDMLYSNFMEFLLFYNNAPYTWDEEQGLVNAARRRIRVDGYGSDASRFIWRQTILRFILSTFTDFQRFGTMVRMCNDIIMQIAKGGSDITDYTISNLVNDCLELMSCDEMSFSYTLGKKTGADGGDPDDEPNDAIHAKATEALMTAYRNGLQQKILPVLFDVLFIFEKKRLGAFARKTLFTIELLCKDHIEHVDTMIMALCPGRAKQILQEMTDPKGLVQKELALRKRDEERDREADLQLLLANLQNKNVPPTTPFALRTPRVKRATMMHGAMVEEPVNQTFATQQIKEEEEENRPNLTSTPLQTALRPTAPLKALTIAAIRNDNLRFVVDALTPKSKQRQEQAVPTPVQPSFAANLANIDEDESDELPTIIPPRRFSVVTSPKTTATKEETMDSLATALAATNTSPDNEPMEEAIESSTKKSGGDDSISSRLKSRKRRSLNQSSAKVEQTKEPNLSTDQASTSVLEVSATEQRQSRRKSSINVNPIVTIRKVPLKGETGEEKENEVGSNLPVQQPTLNIMNDETMIGGRAFSTPNKDPNAMELTFAGLDFSVIAKEPGTARTRRVRPSTSEQND